MGEIIDQWGCEDILGLFIGYLMGMLIYFEISWDRMEVINGILLDYILG
jgi:hypothetical protein